MAATDDDDEPGPGRRARPVGVVLEAQPGAVRALALELARLAGAAWLAGTWAPPAVESPSAPARARMPD